MEVSLSKLVSRFGIKRQDTRDFLCKLVLSQNPFRALTSSDIGTMVPTQTGKRRDREVVRKKIARPLVELGFLEKCTRQTDGAVVQGHPIAKSPNCAYRLTQKVWNLLSNKAPLMDDRMERCARKEEIGSMPISSHEMLVDACVTHLADIHFHGHKVVYRDPSHGPREDERLEKAGLCMSSTSDPYPDLVLWNEGDGSLCVVEAVTTEGAIDGRRHRVLAEWIRRSRPDAEVTYVTAFASWKTACSYMGSLGKGTKAWILESPFDIWVCA